MLTMQAMVDPFKYEKEKYVVSISSGFVISNSVEKVVLMLLVSNALKIFMILECRVIPKKIFDPIKKNKLETSVDTLKFIKTSCNS